MRTALFATLAIFACASAAQAQTLSLKTGQRLPQSLDFVHEPEGQRFTPPPVRFAPTRASASQTNFSHIQATCSAEVAHIYSYRSRIWIACVRRQIEPLGYRVIRMDRADEVAAEYGVRAR